MSKTLKISFVGAGAVNFGDAINSPWNHSLRLDKLSKKYNFEVVAICDLNLEVAKNALAQCHKRGCSIWKNTKLYNNHVKMFDTEKPDCVFIGIPPFAHGKVELDAISRGIHMLIEKPISNGQGKHLDEVVKKLKENEKIICSVAYMFRYSKAVEFIKKQLDGKTIVSLNARYNSSYPTITLKTWWNMKKSGGPIVEQATHFVDLARYFGGDVNLKTVMSNEVEHTSKAGTLTKVAEGMEDGLKHKIPRSLQSMWQYKNNGSLGSLWYGLVEREPFYYSELEIWCDRLRILLSDPYSNKCSVTVNGKETKFSDDDPYYNEDAAFIDACLTGDKSKIKSSFEDAKKTYDLTVAIGKKHLSKLNE